MKNLEISTLKTILTKYCYSINMEIMLLAGELSLQSKVLIPFTTEAKRICHDQNILVVSDFITNTGAVICDVVKQSGNAEEIAFQTIEEKIRKNTAHILQKAVHTGRQPRQIAIELAEQRI